MNKTCFDSINKIWSGSKIPPILNTNVSVGYLILNILRNTPDAISQVSADTGIEWTCQQIYRKSVNIACYLQQLGCKHGDIAGFLVSNTDNLAPTVFACFTLGIPVFSLSPLLSESEMVFPYCKAKPKVIFCDADHILKIEKVVNVLPNACKIFSVDKKVEGFKFIGEIADGDNDTQTFIIPHFDSNSLALILATSGTSDNPKLVCKSHKQIIEESLSQWKSEVSFQQIWFSFSNICWITGMMTLLVSTLYGEKRIITARPFEADWMLAIIAKYNVTTTTILPKMLALLLNCGSKGPFNSMKILMIGGIAASNQICKRAKLIFPNSKICVCYGGSEGGILSMNLTNIMNDSVGQLYGNVEMKILDDDGNQLGVDEAGEIVYKTSVIFQGYFDEPAKTAETIKDGWILSGDVGYFDKNGFLFIIDRKRDIFKCAGINTSATELESIINDIKGVVAACVVGVYQEDLGTYLIFVFVVKESECNLTEIYVEDYVSRKVVENKKLTGGVHFVDSLPMTVTGKVRKGVVRNWAMEKCKKINKDFGRPFVI